MDSTLGTKRGKVLAWHWRLFRTLFCRYTRPLPPHHHDIALQVIMSLRSAPEGTCRDFASVRLLGMRDLLVSVVWQMGPSADVRISESRTTSETSDGCLASLSPLRRSVSVDGSPLVLLSRPDQCRSHVLAPSSTAHPSHLDD
jgi:hypothetical protein